ncbi:MAG: PAS domain S-box protein, partial [Chloroflexota bacterium]|nr:PAS domain S-box protein [Chloroflexota bacterium]
MDESTIHILLVEDEKDHAKLVCRAFERHAGRFSLTVAGNLGQARAYLAESLPNLVIADWLLPDGRGTDLLPAAGEARRFPLIVMTSHGNEQVAVEAMKAGALDYVIKSKTPLADMPRVAARALREWGYIVARQQAEESLRASEERYRTMIENANDMIWTLDAEGHFTFVNHQAEIISGYKFEEVKGRLFTRPIYPDDREMVTEVFRKTLSGESHQYTVRCYKKNGELFILSVNTAPIYEKSKIVGTVSFGRDITKRKQVEEEREHLTAQVRKQAQQMEQILTTVPEGVLLLDAEGQVLLANPVAEGELAVLAAAQVGDVLTRLGDRPLAELLTSPPTKGLWHEVQADDRTFEIIAQPMENVPEPENWVLVIRNVTQEREIQRRTQQQERLAALGQLAAGVAHDFNNIMATIILYIQMSLNVPDLPPQIRQRLETVSGQAHRATDLVQQILDFSRRAVLERRPMDLAPFLEEVVKVLERTLPESIEIEFAYGADEYTVHADPTRVQQAIINLALNARDAMLPQGGGELRIELERVQVKSHKESPLPEMKAGEWVRITVTDTGSGIPPDALAHIFEPFFTTKEVGQGTGLGLAQVYGIVKQHEGHIDVSTEVGAGATFTLYLPVLLASLPES